MKKRKTYKCKILNIITYYKFKINNIYIYIYIYIKPKIANEINFETNMNKTPLYDYDCLTVRCTKVTENKEPFIKRETS